jgi:plasmid stabilization system protein ParE
MKIKWSPLSLQRIQEIADYIAEDNNSAANNWIDEVFEKVKALKDNPEFGRVVPEIGRPDIREILFNNHRIIYLIANREISIVTVRHFKQILPTSEISV